MSRETRTALVLTVLARDPVFEDGSGPFGGGVVVEAHF